MLGIPYVASLFEHPVQSLYVLTGHSTALWRVHHSELHCIGVCDPMYETVTIRIWGHDDMGVMQESPHIEGDGQLGEACAL
jgi:hypothetical protein